MTIVVVLGFFVPPGDFGGASVSTGLFGLFTSDSAARTMSNTYVGNDTRDKRLTEQYVTTG